MSIILNKTCPCCGCSLRISSAELRFWQGVHKTESCWIWKRKPSSNGYGRLSDDEGRDVYAHRFSWELHNGPIPEGLWVLHRCDTPLCVRPDHLFLGTHDDNMADMSTKHRTRFQLYPESVPRGEQNQNAKLTDDDVRSIRQLRTSGMELLALARMFNVSRTTIKLVIKRKIWSHVV